LIGRIPMRIQNFEASLFLFLVSFLIGIELLDHGGAVKIVVGDRGIFENDGDPVMPPAVLRGVIARAGGSLNSFLFREQASCRSLVARYDVGAAAFRVKAAGFDYSLRAFFLSIGVGHVPHLRCSSSTYHIPSAYALG
jgi:hypothetical protein